MDCNSISDWYIIFVMWYKIVYSAHYYNNKELFVYIKVIIKYYINSIYIVKKSPCGTFLEQYSCNTCELVSSTSQFVTACSVWTKKLNQFTQICV